MCLFVSVNKQYMLAMKLWRLVGLICGRRARAPASITAQPADLLWQVNENTFLQAVCVGCSFPGLAVCSLTLSSQG
jgi:hypothetical protein